MPEFLTKWLDSLSNKDADLLHEWLDSEPLAAEIMSDWLASRHDFPD
jgi:hypothetical protein